MKKKEVMRDYKFSDALLVDKGRANVAFIDRDQEKFSDYGVKPEVVAEYKATIEVFFEGLKDVFVLGDQKIATEEKDEKAEEVRVYIRDVMTHVVTKYPEGSARYEKFGTRNLSHLSDAELNIVCMTVYQAGTAALSELRSTGLTEDKLLGLNKMNDEFARHIVAKKFKVADRDILQQDRVKAGNEIYKKLVKYCRIGRNIWETTDVARYNDYLIYNTISGDQEEGVDPVE